MAMSLEARRLKLHELLKSFLGSNRVYYQPPSNIKLEYPCIVYSLRDIDGKRADNSRYIENAIFDVSYIHVGVDDNVVGDLARLPYVIYDRHYVSENLSHDTFIITC